MGTWKTPCIFYRTMLMRYKTKAAQVQVDEPVIELHLKLHSSKEGNEIQCLLNHLQSFVY